MNPFSSFFNQKTGKWNSIHFQNEFRYKHVFFCVLAFSSACNAEAHVCAKIGRVASIRTETGCKENFKITMENPTTLKVLELNSGTITLVTPSVNLLKPSGQALNVRDYTKECFSLEATTSKDLPILTYYDDFKSTNGALYDNLWAASPINTNFF